MIRGTADVLAAAVGAEGMAARFGGEEFCLLLPESRMARALEVAEAARTRVAGLRFRDEEGREFGVTLSAGIAACPEHGTTIDGLLKAADDAVYDAKVGGRDRVRIALPAWARDNLHDAPRVGRLGGPRASGSLVGEPPPVLDSPPAVREAEGGTPTSSPRRGPAPGANAASFEAAAGASAQGTALGASRAFPGAPAEAGPPAHVPSAPGSPWAPEASHRLPLLDGLTPLAVDPGPRAAGDLASAPSDGAARTLPSRELAVRMLALVVCVAGAATGFLFDTSAVGYAPALFVLLIGGVVFLDLVNIDLFERGKISPGAVPSLALAYLLARSAPSPPRPWRRSGAWR